jgi:uncharacterized membrane protein YkoI
MDLNEKNTEDLAEQLAQANERIAEMSQEATDLKIDRQLMQKLAASGAVDLEAALLMARARMNEADDIDQAIAQLKTEKRYLFASGSGGEKIAPRKTAGSKDRGGSRSALLEQAAQKAARTGSRADLQEYLRLRRSTL